VSLKEYDFTLELKIDSKNITYAKKRAEQVKEKVEKIKGIQVVEIFGQRSRKMKKEVVEDREEKFEEEKE